MPLRRRYVLQCILVCAQGRSYFLFFVVIGLDTYYYERVTYLKRNGTRDGPINLPYLCIYLLRILSIN